MKVFALLLTFNVNIITSLLLFYCVYIEWNIRHKRKFISDRITFQNFNNISWRIQSYILNNKYRHSTKVCGHEPNHINIHCVFMYLT